MSIIFRRAGASVAALAIVSALTVACSETTTMPAVEQPSLAGMRLVATGDTTQGSTSQPAGAGYFQGTVMAPAAAGAGNDSLNTSTRIPNVRVTIYVRLSPAGANDVALGAEAGSTVTDASGHFQLPELAPGEYVVSFVPPDGSGYSGVYAFGPLLANSSAYPWWVTLPRK